MNKSTACVVVATVVFLGAACIAKAATREEAKGLVEKVATYWKANWKEKAIAEINNPKGQFTKSGLSVFAHQFNGLVLANGGNPKLVGQNYLEFSDPVGKQFVKECTEVAKTKGSGWVDYLWINPLTKKLQSRTVWVQKIEGTDIYIGSGVWK